MGIITVSLGTPVRAQSILPEGNENNCIDCHENLYFLHDTGNWFCLRESPMLCVDCHGGDPQATTQELAHLNRAAHPVLNEDVTKCQECHPEQCNERLQIFDQTAGISQVRVAVPYIPPDWAGDNASIRIEVAQQENPGKIFTFWEVIPPAFLAGLALGVYLIYRARHHGAKKKEQ